MIARSCWRMSALGLLASTALCSPALAQTAPAPAVQTDPQAPVPEGTSDASASQQAQQLPSAGDGQTPDITEIVVTAQKREENLQNVPVSIQAIGTRRLDQLNISNFEDYTKQLPSVSFQTVNPGSTSVYMRGVATGGDGNHSGSLPSVGTYLDEQPVTTIGGTLDVHIYDIARIESLAGPQGTLYGASSQAGTIRIITNKPELGVTAARLDGEINRVSHGGVGGSLEGMINLPISDSIAFRASAFYQKDAGYIDNVLGSRTYRYSGPGGDLTFDNSDLVDDDINDLDVYGGRAALKIDLNDTWTVTPSVLYQKLANDGVFFQDEDQGDLEVVRFRDEENKDRFVQTALTIEGKIANFDVTYAGAWLDRPTFATSDYTDYTDAYEAYYIAYGSSLLDYQRYLDNDGNVIDPRQHITGRNHFQKFSQEVRFASPAENPFRVLVGAFYQHQTNRIFQDYQVDNLADDLSVPGRPGTIWLTKQRRSDKDYALFGEATWDVTPQITLIGGGRFYKFNNSLFGFAGFGPDNPGGFSSGVRRCLTVNGLQARDDPGAPLLLEGRLPGTPCVNVGNVVDGELVPRRSKGDGFTHRVGAQYRPNKDVMLYATWSRGFRPGGINRQPNAPPYDPDFLTNYEAGWKTTLLNGRIRWNGAIYHQIWKGFQFSFLGENSLTVIQNGRDARIRGIETDVSYIFRGLSLNAAAAYTDAKTKGNICNFALGNADCSGLDDGGDPDFVVTPSGTRLPVTPKFKASGTARYSWDLGTGRAHVQAGVTYQGSASADIRRDLGGGVNPNDYLGRLKAFTLVDLAAGYDWRKFNVELFASNLFDERNELTRFVSCSICTRTHIVVGRPRTIGLRFGTRF